MRVLIVRLGAFGDCLIVTPLIRHLKEIQKFEVYVLTSEGQGKQIFEGNTLIDKIIYHVKDSIPNDKLSEYFESVKDAYECDKVIDLCESIECRLALHPIDPRYKFTKPELMEICNKNYYEETFKIANEQGCNIGIPNRRNPDMFFSEEEYDFINREMKHSIGKFKILWGLSGSSRQKTYPTDHMIKFFDLLCRRYSDIEVFTVGDEICQLLEIPFEEDKRFHRRAGVWNMRQSILASRFVDVVISPDTGLLHGSGCFPTPKIGLLTHTTIENITKHFDNDYSLEAKDVSCAPCFHMVYNAPVQANLAEDHTTPMCMMYGIPPEAIFEQVVKIRKEYYVFGR